MHSSNTSSPVVVRTAQSKNAESKQFGDAIRSARTVAIDQHFTDSNKDESGDNQTGK